VDTVEKNSTSIFSSQHLYLVAFLVCAGHGIADIVRNGRRVSFEFAQTPELLTDVAGFMSGASVPARQFSFELLKLKRMLNGGQNQMDTLNKNENTYVAREGQSR
jgi:hypothetical protein